MHSELFTLVSAEDRSRVFAYGISITGDSGDEAVTYRREPDSGQTLFGVHSCAEAARTRYSMVTPLDLVWEN